MYALKIDWSTAKAGPGDEEQDLHLTLELTDEPDSWWCSSFVHLTERRSRETGHRWYVLTPPRQQARQFTLAGLAPEADSAEIHKELDEIVERTNTSAERARRESQEIQADVEAKARERQRAAEELTNRFRSED